MTAAAPGWFVPLVLAWMALAVLVFPGLLVAAAPYGRHARERLGPTARGEDPGHLTEGEHHLQLFLGAQGLRTGRAHRAGQGPEDQRPVPVAAGLSVPDLRPRHKPVYPDHAVQ